MHRHAVVAWYHVRVATTTVAAYESESVIEGEDFYPYGGQRIDTKTNYGGEKRKYAGTEYDALSAF